MMMMSSSNTSVASKPEVVQMHMCVNNFPGRHVKVEPLYVNLLPLDY